MVHVQNVSTIIKILQWQILRITESMYFLECVTIATAAAVAIDYGILSTVSPDLDHVVTKI